MPEEALAPIRSVVGELAKRRRAVGSPGANRLRAVGQLYAIGKECLVGHGSLHPVRLPRWRGSGGRWRGARGRCRGGRRWRGGRRGTLRKDREALCEAVMLQLVHPAIDERGRRLTDGHAAEVTHNGDPTVERVLKVLQVTLKGAGRIVHARCHLRDAFHTGLRLAFFIREALEGKRRECIAKIADRLRILPSNTLPQCL